MAGISTVATRRALRSRTLSKTVEAGPCVGTSSTTVLGAQGANGRQSIWNVHRGQGGPVKGRLSMYAVIRSLRFADGPDEVHKNALARSELLRQSRTEAPIRIED